MKKKISVEKSIDKSIQILLYLLEKEQQQNHKYRYVIKLPTFLLSLTLIFYFYPQTNYELKTPVLVLQ